MNFLEYIYFVGSYLLLAVFLKILWRKRTTLWLIVQTFGRDLRLFKALLIKSLFWDYLGCRLKNKTVCKCFDEIAYKKPNRVCFYYESEKWTYRQVQTMSFQVANFFQAQGLRKGDVVGIAMNNQPEVICIWLGLSRLGVISALINFNLRGDSLEHSVTVAKCKAVVFGSKLREAFGDIWNSRQQRDEPQSDVTFYELDRYLDGLYPISQKFSIPIEKSKSSSSFEPFQPNDFAACLRTASSKPTILDSTNKNDVPQFMDSFLYVYTSGTTGMPKAARQTHSRFMVVAAGAFNILKLTENDITYCPLPLYHIFALGALGWALVYGVPLVIVPKFSASKFWSDIHYYKATVNIYMGELCRYIVSQPPQPELESNHSLRLMFGVGVRPEVWEAFVRRFKVDRFVESYGSSEGNCTLVNMDGTKIGAMGYIPILAESWYSVTVIKVDELTGDIYRNKQTGFAIPCKHNEPGELVGKITDIIPSLRFEGYTNQSATEKKIARNVFRKGDRYFRSGDIVTRDDHGYYYFKDRIGDTFRWKGENVSTAEVESLILRLCDMRTTVVYGVKVPETEGRAGMATICDPEGSLDLEKLGEGLHKGLPSYAIPVFIRIIRSDDELDMTGTYKVKKMKLQEEGFDIERIDDPVYIYNSKSHSYQKLELNTFKQILQGNYRL